VHGLRSRRPPHRDLHRALDRAETEEELGGCAREVALARAQGTAQEEVARRHRDLGPDAEGVGTLSAELDPQGAGPGRARGVVAEQAGGAVVRRDQEVLVPVAVEVAGHHAARGAGVSLTDQVLGGLLERAGLRGEEQVVGLTDADARRAVVGARVAVRHVEVEVAVQVEVHQGRAPARDPDPCRSDPGCDGPVPDPRAARAPGHAPLQEVQVERVGLQLPVGEEDVLVPVGVDVRDGEAHAPPGVVHAGLERDVAEGAVPLVLEQDVRGHVVGDVQVLVAVPVEVPPHGLHAEAGRVLRGVAHGARLGVVHAELLGHLLEREDALVEPVAQQLVALPREQVGQHLQRVLALDPPLRILRRHQARVVLQVARHVHVEVAVPVVVRGAGGRAPELQVGQQVARLAERAVPAPEQQAVATLIGEVEIEVPVAIGVEGERSHPRVAGSETGALARVPEAALAVAQEEAVGEGVLFGSPRALDQHEVGMAVPVEVAPGCSRTHRRADVHLEVGTLQVHQLDADLAGHVPQPRAAPRGSGLDRPAGHARGLDDVGDDGE